MTADNKNWFVRHWGKSVWPSLLMGLAIAGWFTRAQWMPYADQARAFIQNERLESEGDQAPEVAATAPDTLKLTPTAWKNLGLKTGEVGQADFVKVVSVPAIVVERPGRSQVEIAAPMTGVVTKVFPLEREAIEPGQPLFELRLTHEDVVSAQAEFLRQLQGLDAINRELNRLEGIGQGVIPGKRIIEQNYKRDQSLSALATIRQSLLLHGMSADQVALIEKNRHVIQTVMVAAPPYAENHEHTDVKHQYHVQAVKVNRGQNVTSGELLGVLADHCLLYVEGKAFEDDANRLFDASRAGKEVAVVATAAGSQKKETIQLHFQSVSDQIDPQSRALKFYLLLNNETLHAPNSEDQFVVWKYRPGQRMEAKIPTSSVLKNKIVLPASAVVIDGPNAFVFEQNGDNFDRLDVQVLYRDRETVVLENDGQLIGSVIAMNGAFEMHLALKNQGGGAVDPHAGHSH